MIRALVDSSTRVQPAPVTNVYIPEQPAPEVRVEAPIVNVAAPEVRVEPPVVNVTVEPTPIRNEVTVEPPAIHVEPTPVEIRNEVTVGPTPIEVTVEPDAGGDHRRAHADHRQRAGAAGRRRDRQRAGPAGAVRQRADAGHARRADRGRAEGHPEASSVTATAASSRSRTNDDHGPARHRCLSASGSIVLGSVTTPEAVPVPIYGRRPRRPLFPIKPYDDEEDLVLALVARRRR